MYKQLNEDKSKIKGNGRVPVTDLVTIATSTTEKKVATITEKGSKASLYRELNESLIDAPENNESGETPSWSKNIDPEIGSSNSGGPIMQSDDDPFYVFKEDLLMKLDVMDVRLNDYKGIALNTDVSAKKSDVKTAKKQLKRSMKNAESTLKDLQTTIRVVENNRDKYLNIDDSELFDRKKFVSISADRIKATKTEISSNESKAKIVSDEKESIQRRKSDINDQMERENSHLIQNAQSGAQLMLQEQDETLDELDQAVDRVGTMAGNIHDELGHQNKMLNELEEDMDDVEEKLGLVMGKLSMLLKTKSRCQLAIILIMCLLVLILLFLVVYT